MVAILVLVGIAFGFVLRRMSSEERLRFAQAIVDGLVFIKDSIAKPPSGGEGFYAALKARTTWALVTPAIVIAYIVVFGMMNFTPMTMQPPMLQSVAGYPDSTIGWVIGARGLGTMVGFSVMIWASRFDPRVMIALGFLLQAYAGWQLAQMDPGFGVHDVFWPMALQGLGVGLLWVPITMVAFSTLEGERLAEATSVYHMLRNIGSSVHISLSTVLAVHMAQVNYAELSPNVSRYNEALALPWVRGSLDLADPQSLGAIEREIARQASMLGYLDSFWAFSATALAVLPLILLVRWKR